MKAFRLFCLCLSKVILVGLLHGICGLEGGTNMLLYNFKKAFVYFDFGDTPAIYTNNIHSFTYHETGKQGNGSWDVGNESLSGKLSDCSACFLSAHIFICLKEEERNLSQNLVGVRGQEMIQASNSCSVGSWPQVHLAPPVI